MRIFISFLLLISLLVQVITKDPEESLCNTPEGKDGVCINLKAQIKFCQPLQKLLTTRAWPTLRKSICSKDNSRVCCPVENFNENVSRDDEPSYKEHKNFGLLPALTDCGQVSSSDRILNGMRSQPGDHPFVVRIGVQADEDSPIQHVCGGSIISKRYILTAAHCVKVKVAEVVLGQTDEDLEEECIKARNKNGTLTNIACSKPIRLKPAEVISHPNYTKQTGSEYDIALIRLPEDVNLTSQFRRPICLPFLAEYFVIEKLGDSKILRDNNTYVAGWGKTTNVENIGSSTLQYAPIPIQPNILCRVTYNTYNIGNGQICAGGVKNQDSCLGDSGGPLFQAAVPNKYSPFRAARYFQLGIVSYGKAVCGRGNEPVVYTRVRSFLTWILDNLKP